MRAVALPGRIEAWDLILDASGIHSHDYDKADGRWRRWRLNPNRHECPPPWEGGEFDPVNCWLGLEGKRRARGALHSFYLLTRGATTWVDVLSALAILRQVPGLERLRIPDSVRSQLLDALDYWQHVETLLLR